MAEEKVGFFKRLVNGLTKTRDSIVAGIDSIFSGYSNIDDDFMRRSRRFSSWEISASIQRPKL